MKIVAPTLETKRLELLDIEDKDTSEIVKWRSNPDVYKFFLSQHPLTRDEHLNWYNGSYIYNNNRFDWMARERDTHKSVGVFGVKRESEQSKTAEVSYILAPEHQGKGYASEAVLRTIQFAKEYWHCDKVIAEIHQKNEMSISLAKRLGFTYVRNVGEFCVYERNI